MLLQQTVKKHLWRSLIFNKTTGCFLYNFLKKNTSRQIFAHSAMVLIAPQHKWFLILWCTWINSTAAVLQFGIFNVKRKYFFRCFTSRHIKIWNMHTDSYEVFFISNTQFMLWSFWTQWHHRNYSCTFFPKSQVVKLEMFFDWP